MSRVRSFCLGACAAVLALGGPARAEVDDLGAYQSEIPIEVPAYHGLEPRIALAYDSNTGNGLVGVGWRLQAGSTIVRVSAFHGAPRFDSSDVHLLDGVELVPCAPGSASPSCTSAVAAFGSSDRFYSTRIESFQRIGHDPRGVNWWVWAKNGTKATYSTGNSGRTYRLDLIEDTHGNQVAYNYWCDGTYDDCYLERITYAGTPKAAGAEIRFFLEPRPDPIESGTGGGLRHTRYRLKSIAVSMAGQLARAYALGYATSTATGASVLASFQKFGRDATVDTTVDAAGTVTAGATPALPPMTFETPSMGASAGAWEFPGITVQPDLPTFSPPWVPSYSSHYNNLKVRLKICHFDTDIGEWSCNQHTSLTADWNGDGRSDVLSWDTPPSCGRLSLNAILTRPSGAGPVIADSFSTGITGVTEGNCTIGVWPADLDGEGRTTSCSI